MSSPLSSASEAVACHGEGTIRIDVTYMKQQLLKAFENELDRLHGNFKYMQQRDFNYLQMRNMFLEEMNLIGTVNDVKKVGDALFPPPKESQLRCTKCQRSYTFCNDEKDGSGVCHECART
jgi:hypothetical protein